jgi:hypothetical protein
MAPDVQTEHGRAWARARQRVILNDAALNGITVGVTRQILVALLAIGPSVGFFHIVYGESIDEKAIHEVLEATWQHGWIQIFPGLSPKHATPFSRSACRALR